MATTKHIGLRLPEDLYEKVKAAAEDDQRSMHNWLLLAIAHYLHQVETQSRAAAVARPRLTLGQRMAVRAADVRRGQQELTQKMLADTAGVSLRQVADFLAGRSWPRANNRVKLATALAWPRNELDRMAAEYDDEAEAREATR